MPVHAFHYTQFDGLREISPKYSGLDFEVFDHCAWNAVKRRFGDEKFAVLGRGQQSVVLHFASKPDHVLKLSYVTKYNDCSEWLKNAGRRWFDAPMTKCRYYALDKKKPNKGYGVMAYFQPLLKPMRNIEARNFSIDDWFADYFRPTLQPYVRDYDGYTAQWGWSQADSRWYLVDYGAYTCNRRTINRHIIKMTMGNYPDLPHEETTC